MAPDVLLHADLPFPKSLPKFGTQANETHAPLSTASPFLKLNDGETAMTWLEQTAPAILCAIGLALFAGWLFKSRDEIPDGLTEDAQRELDEQDARDDAYLEAARKGISDDH